MKTKCPYCNYIATEHETLEKDEYPIDEDISFCINCAEISKYLNGVLIKVDIDSLDKETRKEVRDIETAWLRTRPQVKLVKEMDGEND